MVICAISQTIVLLVTLGKFEREWAVRRALLVPLRTLIGRLAFLAAIAVEDVHAVAIWIVAFRSLRYELNV